MGVMDSQSLVSRSPSPVPIEPSSPLPKKRATRLIDRDPNEGKAYSMASDYMPGDSGDETQPDPENLEELVADDEEKFTKLSSLIFYQMEYGASLPVQNRFRNLFRGRLKRDKLEGLWNTEVDQHHREVKADPPVQSRQVLVHMIQDELMVCVFGLVPVKKQTLPRLTFEASWLASLGVIATELEDETYYINTQAVMAQLRDPVLKSEPRMVALLTELRAPALSPTALELVQKVFQLASQRKYKHKAAAKHLKHVLTFTFPHQLTSARRGAPKWPLPELEKLYQEEGSDWHDLLFDLTRRPTTAEPEENPLEGLGFEQEGIDFEP